MLIGNINNSFICNFVGSKNNSSKKLFNDKVKRIKAKNLFRERVYNADGVTREDIDFLRTEIDLIKNGGNNTGAITNIWGF